MPPWTAIVRDLSVRLDQTERSSQMRDGVSDARTYTARLAASTETRARGPKRRPSAVTKSSTFARAAVAEPPKAPAVPPHAAALPIVATARIRYAAKRAAGRGARRPTDSAELTSEGTTEGRCRRCSAGAARRAGGSGGLIQPRASHKFRVLPAFALEGLIAPWCNWQHA